MAPNLRGILPESHTNQFQIDLYTTPGTQKLWFLLQVNNLNIFLKRDVSKKSNIDTTIDYVKTPRIFKNTHFLEHFRSKNNLE
jgi:hypothetical protein